MSEYDAHADHHDHDDWSEPPRWPKVVGIISIVWGVLGIVCNGLGAVSAAMSPKLMQMASAEMEGGFPPSMSQVNLLMVVVAIVSLLTAVGLLMAGIFTVNRRPQGRPLHVVVALVSLALLVVGVMMQWQSMNEIAEWVRNNPDAMFSQNYNASGSLIAMAFGVIIGGAWPTFTLIWFGALKKRPEVGAPEVL